MKQYYVYIMTNQSGTLYTGVSNDEHTRDIHLALTREKQLKVWTRARKLELIAKVNPKWQDLSVEWDLS